MLQPGTFGLTLLLAMLTALGPLSMDMYLPSLPDIAHVLAAPPARTGGSPCPRLASNRPGTSPSPGVYPGRLPS